FLEAEIGLLKIAASLSGNTRRFRRNNRAGTQEKLTTCFESILSLRRWRLRCSSGRCTLRAQERLTLGRYRSARAQRFGSRLTTRRRCRKTGPRPSGHRCLLAEV